MRWFAYEPHAQADNEQGCLAHLPQLQCPRVHNEHDLHPRMTSM